MIEEKPIAQTGVVVAAAAEPGMEESRGAEEAVEEPIVGDAELERLPSTVTGKVELAPENNDEPE